jgi:hypothetical protein
MPRNHNEIVPCVHEFGFWTKEDTAGQCTTYAGHRIQNCAQQDVEAINDTFISTGLNLISFDQNSWLEH